MNNQTPSSGSPSLYYKLIKLLNTFIVSIKNNVLLFLLCLAIGITPFLLKNIFDKGNFKASFTIAYDELFRKIYGDRLAKIDALIQRKEYKKVANSLGVDVEVVKSLVKVEGKNILGEDLKKDLNTDHIPFIVNIVVSDSAAVTKLQDGLVSFLETGNEFLSDRKKVKLLENSEELEYIGKQMLLMDSMAKKGFVGGGFNMQKSNTATENNNGSIFEFSYELYKRKQELLRKQRMPVGLMLVDDAIVSVKTDKPIGVVAIYGIALGLAIYILLIAIIIPAFKFKETN